MMFAEILKWASKRLSPRKVEDADEYIKRAARDVRAGAAWSVRRILVAGQKPKKETEREPQKNEARSIGTSRGETSQACQSGIASDMGI